MLDEKPIFEKDINAESKKSILLSFELVHEANGHLDQMIHDNGHTFDYLRQGDRKTFVSAMHTWTLVLRIRMKSRITFEQAITIVTLRVSMKLVELGLLSGLSG